jgi:CHAD domain-containing protein
MPTFIHNGQDTVETLMQRYAIDPAHAQHVARLATGIFDLFQPVHRLSTRSRELLSAGALLHHVGRAVDESAQHLAGRDILIASSLQSFDPVERAILACMVAFHRKTVDAGKEPLMQALSDAQQQQTLALSALLRVADGLDDSLTQTTELEECTPVEDGESEALELRVCGPYSHEDAARALKKADLWDMLFPTLHIRARMTRPGITLGDTLGDAGQRLLRYQVDQLSTGEWRVVDGELPHPGQVHRLRTTVRRLRSTLRVFKPYYKSKAVQPISDGLRALAAALGPAREQDVTLKALRSYQQAVDEATRANLQPMLALWQDEREQAYAACGHYLGGEPHAAWLQASADFVQAEGVERAPEPGRPSRVRHALELIVAEHLADVRAYDVLPDPPPMKDIHNLRIAIKRLHYVCEGLSEVLPAERVQKIVSSCSVAQSAYGELVDAHLAAQRALHFVAGHRTAYADAQVIRAALAFARAQQQTVDEGLLRWRLYAESLLML